MASGYEHLTSQQFWAEVDGLLELLVRHNGGTPASQVHGLADYVHREAERRDPELAASARRRTELVTAVAARTPRGLAAWGAALPFTDDEEAERQQLVITYNQRLASLAAASGR